MRAKKRARLAHSELKRCTLIRGEGRGEGGFEADAFTTNFGSAIGIIYDRQGGSLMRATSSQEHEAERCEYAVIQMGASHLQQGCETPRLTSQERAVLELLCRYDHVSQVAAALYVQPDTVRKHLRHIYRKLGVHSLHRAIVRALALGLIEPPTEPHDDATPPNPPVERQKSAKFPKLGD